MTIRIRRINSSHQVRPPSNEESNSQIIQPNTPAIETENTDDRAISNQGSNTRQTSPLDLRCSQTIHDDLMNCLVGSKKYPHLCEETLSMALNFLLSPKMPKCTIFVYSDKNILNHSSESISNSLNEIKKKIEDISKDGSAISFEEQREITAEAINYILNLAKYLTYIGSADGPLNILYGNGNFYKNNGDIYRGINHFTVRPKVKITNVEIQEEQRRKAVEDLSELLFEGFKAEIVSRKKPTIKLNEARDPLSIDLSEEEISFFKVFLGKPDLIELVRDIIPNIREEINNSTKSSRLKRFLARIFSRTDSISKTLEKKLELIPSQKPLLDALIKIISRIKNDNWTIEGLIEALKIKSGLINPNDQQQILLSSGSKIDLDSENEKIIIDIKFSLAPEKFEKLKALLVTNWGARYVLRIIRNMLKLGFYEQKGLKIAPTEQRKAEDFYRKLCEALDQETKTKLACLHICNYCIAQTNEDLAESESEVLNDYSAIDNPTIFSFVFRSIRQGFVRSKVDSRKLIQRLDDLERKIKSNPGLGDTIGSIVDD